MKKSRNNLEEDKRKNKKNKKEHKPKAHENAIK
jgi:hypothetical protein